MNPALYPILFRKRSLDAAVRALFAAGERGYWFDINDLSTLFQDVAGTVPVTAVGQMVAFIRDKSGNGCHATQGTSMARMILRQDGNGNYYLECDGIDDYFSVPIPDMPQPFTFHCGVQFSVIKTEEMFKGASGANGFLFSNGLFQIYANAGGGLQANTPQAQIGTSYIFTGQLNNAVSRLIRVNGVQRNADSGVGNSIMTGPMGLFGRPGSTFVGGRMYGGSILRGALSNTAQMAAAEAYLNAKTGAY